MADLEELTSVATLVSSAFAALLVVATLLRARPEAVGSRAGWGLVAAGVAVFALRVLGHFDESAAVQDLRHVAGIVGAILLVAGFWSIQKEADRRAR